MLRQVLRAVVSCSLLGAAVTIRYQGGKRRYSAPFATNAQLAIGHQHH